MKHLFEHIVGNVYCIDIPLKNSPLKNLNSYVIKGEDRNLIIDTGYPTKSCLAAMLEGLEELQIDMNKTDLFITHMHHDHLGLINELKTPSTKVFMSTEDTRRLVRSYEPAIDLVTIQTQTESGFPKDEINIMKSKGCYPFEDFTTFDDGAIFTYGDHTMRAIATPGHCPGHMCLYDEENEIMFLGDHVLFNITPNINRYKRVPDSLGQYVTNLMKIRDLKVTYPLPAHRIVTGTMAERIDEIIEHHGVRVRDTLDVVYAVPGSTAYQIAGKVSWNIRHEGGWENFPATQKGFAVGEMRAHLEYLAVRDRVVRVERDGVFYYYPPIKD